MVMRFHLIVKHVLIAVLSLAFYVMPHTFSKATIDSGYVWRIVDVNGKLFASVVQDSQFIYTSTDSGASWKQVTRGLESQDMVHAFTAIGDTVYCSSIFHGVYKFDNSSETWIPINKTGLDSMFVFSLASSGNTLFAGVTMGKVGESGLYKLLNDGSDWVKYDSGSNAIKVVQNSITVNQSFMLIGTMNGTNYSTDGGIFWNYSDSGLVNKHSLATASCGANALAGTYRGAYISTDGCVSWKRISEFPDEHVTSFAVSDSSVYTISAGQLYISHDFGMSWFCADSGLPYIISIAVMGNYLFAGTEREGILKCSLDKFVAKEVLNGESVSGKRVNISPNPSNPSTSIEISGLRCNIQLNLRIVDSKGVRIYERRGLSDESGKAVFDWSGADNNSRKVRSGVYFAEVSGQDFMLTKKIVLVR